MSKCQKLTSGEETTWMGMPDTTTTGMVSAPEWWVGVCECFYHDFNPVSLTDDRNECLNPFSFFSTTSVVQLLGVLPLLRSPLFLSKLASLLFHVAGLYNTKYVLDLFSDLLPSLWNTQHLFEEVR